MSITKALVSGFCCLPLVGSFASSQVDTTPLCKFAPMFPQYEGQTAGAVDAVYNPFCNFKVWVAESKDGELVPYDAAVHSALMIKENHDKFPPQHPLTPNEGIGVVIYGVEDWMKYVLWALGGAIVGLVVGLAVGRK